MKALGAAVLLVALAAIAHAQPVATVKEARALLAAGKPAEALEALADAKTVDALSLKTEAAARARKFDVAAATYAALAKTTAREDARLLNLIGREQLLVVQASGDRLGRVAVCDALPAAAIPEGIPCLKLLREWTRDESAPYVLRVAAAASLARGGDAAAAATLTGLAGKDPTSPSRRLLLSVLEGVPSAVAVPLIVPMLQDEDGGVQFSAASALGEHRTPAARAALQHTSR